MSACVHFRKNRASNLFIKTIHFDSHVNFPIYFASAGKVMQRRSATSSVSEHLVGPNSLFVDYHCIRHNCTFGMLDLPSGLVESCTFRRFFPCSSLAKLYCNTVTFINAGVPKLSLTMYLFSISTDGYAPLKYLMTKKLIKITNIHWIFNINFIF